MPNTSTTVLTLRVDAATITHTQLRNRNNSMPQKMPDLRNSPVFLGIESGGTRTVALLANAEEHCLKRIERSGPANLRQLDHSQLTALFGEIASQVAAPAALGIGMAGVIGEGERRQVREAAARVWPATPCWVGNDLETALAAASDQHDKAAVVRVIVISGTGSSCFGRGLQGEEALTSGWGHLLGDRGSGYDIALKGLQAVFAEQDRSGRWPKLGQRFLRALQLNSEQEIINWVQNTDKRSIAALAVEVFQACASRDPLAARVVDDAALALAASAESCAARLAKRNSPVEFVFTGSVLLKQPGFARRVALHLRKGRPGATVRSLHREGAWGGVTMALRIWASSGKNLPPNTDQFPQSGLCQPASQQSVSLPRPTGLPPTERRNPRSKNLDRLSSEAAVRLMITEEMKVPVVLMGQRRKIAEAVELVASSFKAGGKLFYVGAGTSGRIGVLDASECPPTFSTPPDMVQGILAGGQSALWGSYETAEDDAASGAQAMISRGVSARDVVVGIAASGRTPFIWGALLKAKHIGARTILISFNPELEISPETAPTLAIICNTGPEVLTGSTRLKAGTGTKILLNMITTLSMVRLGKVVENLMVEVQPGNSKLQARAARILGELTGLSEPDARQALEENGWSIKGVLAQMPSRKPR